MYYEDVQLAAQTALFTESVYADDLICFRSFAGGVGNDFILSCLRQCQREVHTWGKANAVTFENIWDFRHPVGPNFTLLGVLFDPSLSMFHAVSKITREASFRLRRVLRLRSHYSVKELITFYKSEVLSYVEGATIAYFHATPYVLAMVDDIQTSFLASLNIDAVSALCKFNLAPLGCRQDIAMLGTLHKIALGMGPAPIAKLFPLATSALHTLGWTGGPAHFRQLADPVYPQSPLVLKRSIFGMVAVYNRLPSAIVRRPSVKLFQSSLQLLLKEKASCTTDGSWEAFFKRTC